MATKTGHLVKVESAVVKRTLSKISEGQWTGNYTFKGLMCTSCKIQISLAQNVDVAGRVNCLKHRLQATTTTEGYPSSLPLPFPFLVTVPTTPFVVQPGLYVFLECNTHVHISTRARL